jgi:hypothetical protein
MQNKPTLKKISVDFTDIYLANEVLFPKDEGFPAPKLFKAVTLDFYLKFWCSFLGI